MIQVKKDYLTPMAVVIRQAILDKEAMSELTVKDLTDGLHGAVHDLTPADIRGFIYRCMTNRGEVPKGFVMVEKAVDFALSMKASGKTETASEIIDTVIGSHVKAEVAGRSTY